MKQITVGMLIAMLFAAPCAHAMEKKSEDVTAYTFKDVLVEGVLIAPDGDIIPSRKPGRQRSLIKIRKDFIQEMLRQAKNI